MVDASKVKQNERKIGCKWIVSLKPQKRAFNFDLINLRPGVKKCHLSSCDRRCKEAVFLLLQCLFPSFSERLNGCGSHDQCSTKLKYLSICLDSQGGHQEWLHAQQLLRYAVTHETFFHSYFNTRKTNHEVTSVWIIFSNCSHIWLLESQHK